MSKRPAKPPTVKYMDMWTSQPVTIQDYVLYHTTELGSIRKILARLLLVMVSRRLLNAAELTWVVEGRWHARAEFADWSPKKEIHDGREIEHPIISKSRR